MRRAAIIALALALAGCGSSSTKTVERNMGTVVQTGTTRTVTRVLHTAKPKIIVRNRVHTVIRTVTVTHTVTAPATSAAAGYASSYPLSFEASFDQSCVQSGASSSQCTCVLKHIEVAVPYSTMITASHSIFTGDPPGWFTAARSACGVG